MKQMKQQNEVENLLSLIFQSGGQVMVKDGQLLVGPPELAQKFGDQIRRLKPEILIAFNHCPKCGYELSIKIEDLPWGSSRAEENIVTRRTGRHAYCFFPWHYDKWEF